MKFKYTIVVKSRLEIYTKLKTFKIIFTLKV